MPGKQQEQADGNDRSDLIDAREPHGPPGINLYAAILVLGWMGGAGHVDLPPGLEVLSDPAVMLAAGGMYMVEFFTDKIPGVDTGWDALHTFIRIPAGALMAAGAAQGLDIGQAGELIGLILGGGVAAASHATKAGTRVMINTSPEPVQQLGRIGCRRCLGVRRTLGRAEPSLAVRRPAGAVPARLSLAAATIWRAIKRAAHAVRRWFGGRGAAGNRIMARAGGTPPGRVERAVP